MIEIENLTKTFASKSGPVEVLRDLSLTVAPGEIHAVVGPSGAGKSTLARCVSLLERPTSGEIRVDGIDLSRQRGAALRKSRQTIGTIFQQAPLLGRKTVFENVALPLRFLGATDRAIAQRVPALLEEVGLTERSGYYPGQLSGGQRQRVDIARALVLGPSNLLSDEATSGLDPATTRSILGLLGRLREEHGLSIVLITHEMQVVREIADSVSRIEGGRFVESGAIGDILLDPASALGRELLPARPVVAGTVDPRDSLWDVSYASRTVALDWISQLHRSLPTLSIRVLSATIEGIRGVSVGRTVVAVDGVDDEEFAEALGAIGLVGQRIAAPEAVRPPEDPPAKDAARPTEAVAAEEVAA